MLPCGGGRSRSGVIGNVIESSGQSANRRPGSGGTAQAPFEGGDRQRLNAFRTGRLGQPCASGGAIVGGTSGAASIVAGIEAQDAP